MSIGPLLVYSFSILMKPLVAEFGWSRGDVSNGSMLVNLAGAVAAPVLGNFLDKWGSRRIMLIGHLGLALTAGLLALLQSHLWLLLALYTAGGILGAGCTPVPYARLIARWFVYRRGLALGIVMAGVGVGSFFIPMILQAAISTYGWRAAYVAISVMAVALPVPLILFVLREAPAQAAGGAPHQGKTRKEALATGVYWQMTTAFFIVAMCSNAVVAHLSPLMTDTGVSPARAAFAVSLFGASAVVGRVLTGWLVDRFFAGHVIAILFTGLAGGMALLAAGKLGYAAAVLVGLGLGAEVDVMPYLISRYFGFRSFGEIYGFTFSAFTLGMAAGPVLMGYGFDAAKSYQTPLFLLIALLLAAVALVWFLPRYEDTGHL